MAFNEKLAQRVRKWLEGKPGFDEKKMFGGVCFLLYGNMACGILNDDVIVRVGPNKYESALERPGTRKFDITGKPMTGWVMVSTEGTETGGQLSSWVEQGVGFALTLPRK